MRRSTVADHSLIAGLGNHTLHLPQQITSGPMAGG
jgi:hypothetical protein